MTTGTAETVRGRIGRARATTQPTRAALALAAVVALGVTLLFVQEPAVHDALHNFRHGAGVTCN